MNQLVSDVKRALEEIKRLRGKVDSLNSVTTGSSSGTTSGVLLSDNNPTANNPGQPSSSGVGTLASRDDHQHETFEESGAGKYLQFVYTGDNPFEFVTDVDGQPVFAELDVIPE